MLKSVLRVPSGAADDAELPLVILMHGRGADANDLADVAEMIDPPGGARFLFPNAPRPFEPAPGMSFGWSWFTGWPAERESFLESRRLILDFLDDALRKYPTPPGKVILSGFSQGAMMAIDTGYRTGQPIAGIVAMSGAVNEAELPDVSAKKDLPILIVHGSVDDMIPVLAARRARRLLEERGIEPEYHEFPMGHHVTPESMAVVADFIRRRLA